jgi:alanine racemase
MTSLVSHVAEAKRVGKNEMIGYFGAYQAENDMYIGLVPLGWGQRNFYANTNGQAISDNHLCSIVGLISANNLVIASRLAPFRRGQRVYFLGPYAGGALTLDDLANASQSFIPRVVSQIGRSIERVYYLEES